jgi:hypothetical protein
MPKAIAMSTSLAAGDPQLAAPAAVTGRGVDLEVTGFYDETTGSVQYIVAILSRTRSHKMCCHRSYP